MAGRDQPARRIGKTAMNALDRRSVRLKYMESEPTWFDVFIEHFESFVREHGHCRITVSHTCSDGYKLGRTINSIRSGLNKLTKEQQVLLDSRGFIWNASRVWYPEFVVHLKAFVLENGHCRVPVNHVCPDGYKLGRMTAYARARRASFTEEQQNDMNAMGFVWQVTRIWYPEFIEHMEAFILENGHCRVSMKYVCPDGYKLGWVVNRIRMGDNKPTEEQRAELDSRGFIWDATPVWYPEFIRHLDMFILEYGHCMVPSKYVCPDGYKLGQKVNSIRSGRNRTLEEQRSELDSRGFTWNASQYGLWYPEFKDNLEEFKVEYGHARVPFGYVCLNGYRLGLIASRVRSGDNRPTDEQRAELDSLEFPWKVR